ncbi:sensor histidine kinase, partial [Actinomadura sp. HBU206391]|uniref:sensor histidine kinase n=1 Tax=Actinomadura sp. HBU206391 TaxID=2731692 RepID=UPI0016504A2C
MRFTTRQDVLLAVAALAGGLLLHAAGAHVNWGDGWTVASWWRLVPLAVVCAVMPLRRTAPVAALAVATVAFAADVAIGLSYGTALVYTDALYAAGVYGPKRPGAWLLRPAVGVSLVFAVAFGVVVHSLSWTVVVGAVLAVELVGPVLTGMIVRQHRDQAAAERLRADQVARLAELDRRTAVNAERTRMARELHDVIANHLSAVALHSSAALKMPDMAADQVRQALTVIRESSVEGLAEMRRMIGLLRAQEGVPDESPRTPRLDGIERLVEQIGRPDLEITHEVRGRPGELPAAIELAAYRIAQESLTNVLKHAGPGRAEMVVDHRDEIVSITVESPLGDHTAPVDGAGAGLIGMRERVALLGGRFTAGPRSGRWRV